MLLGAMDMCDCKDDNCPQCYYLFDLELRDQAYHDDGTPYGVDEFINLTLSGGGYE